MRVTSPPKYHNQPNKSRSPLKTQPNMLVRGNSDLYQQQEHKIHHLRSSSRLSTKTENRKIFSNSNSNKQLPLSDRRQNLYKELISREAQYMGLIKDMHQENNNLKLQIERLKHQEETKLFLNNQHPVRMLPPQRIKQISLTNVVNAQTNAYNNGFNPIPIQKIMSKTFSNFGSPPKVMQVNPNRIQHEKQLQHHHHHQQQLNSSYRSPFSKKPLLMSNTSPNGFQMKGCVRNNSPCIRPVINQLPIATSQNKKTTTQSFRPSLMSYQPSIVNESRQISPKKQLSIINVLNTAITTPNSQRKIVFEETDDSKQQVNENHMNPLNSKKHRQQKNIKQQQIEQQKLKFKDDLVNRITNDPLLSKLKQRLQHQQIQLSLQPKSHQSLNQSLQQSQCLAFIKPSSTCNSNIRHSNGSVKKDISIEAAYIINPMERDVLTGFPILNKLRLAQSAFEKGQGDDGDGDGGMLEIRVQQVNEQMKNVNDNQQQQQKQQQKKQRPQDQNLKNQSSFNIIKSQISKQSRLSSKISKQSQSQSYIDQALNNSRNNNQSKPLTIIRMLDQTVNQNQFESKQGHSMIIQQSKYSEIRESVIEHSSQSRLTEKSSQHYCANLVCLDVPAEVQDGGSIGIQRQSQREESFQIQDPQLNDIVVDSRKVEQQQSCQDNQKEEEQLQHQPVKPANFNNRLYYEDTENDSIAHGNQYSPIEEQIHDDDGSRSVKQTPKIQRINNQIKNRSTILPSHQNFIHSQQTTLSLQIQPNDKSQQQQQIQQLQQKISKFENINSLEKEDQSIEVDDENDTKHYQYSFTKQSQVMNQSQLSHQNKENHKLASSSVTSKFNKTTPSPFYPQQQISQSKNKRYIQNNISLSSNEWGQGSTTLKSQKIKKISNQAYL